MTDEDVMWKRVPYQGGWLPVTYRDELARREQRINALQAENAAMREIVQAVADGEACWYDALGQHCGFCDQIFDPRVHDRVSHATGCLVPKARAALAKEGE